MEPIPAETTFVPKREWIRLAAWAVAAGFSVPGGILVLALFSSPAPPRPGAADPEPSTLAETAAALGSISLLQLLVTVGVFVVFGVVLVSTKLLNQRDRSPRSEL